MATVMVNAHYCPPYTIEFQLIIARSGLLFLRFFGFSATAAFTALRRGFTLTEHVGSLNADMSLPSDPTLLLESNKSVVSMLFLSMNSIVFGACL